MTKQERRIQALSYAGATLINVVDAAEYVTRREPSTDAEWADDDAIREEIRRIGRRLIDRSERSRALK